MVAVMGPAITTATALFPVCWHAGTPSIDGTSQQMIDTLCQELIQPFAHLVLHGRLDLGEGCPEHLASVDFPAFWL
jgi:hypothetical protein